MIVGDKIQWNKENGGDLEEVIRISRTTDDEFMYILNKEGEDFNTFLPESSLRKLIEHNVVVVVKADQP